MSKDQALADQPPQRRLDRIRLLACTADRGGKLQIIALDEFESGNWAIAAEVARQMLFAVF